MNKKKKIWLGIILTLCLIGIIALIGIGGKIYMDKKYEAQQQAAIEVVKENENLIKDNVHHDDKYKRVNSITIDYDTVKINPMGGIMVDGYVNDNKKLIFYAMLEVREKTGKLGSTGISTSPDYQKAIEKGDENDK